MTAPDYALVLKADELQAEDVILGWRHGDTPYQQKSNWVVKTPLGEIKPAGKWGIEMHKPNPDSEYELNLWLGTDIDQSTVFYVSRGHGKRFKF